MEAETNEKLIRGEGGAIILWQKKNFNELLGKCQEIWLNIYKYTHTHTDSIQFFLVNYIFWLNSLANYSIDLNINTWNNNQIPCVRLYNYKITNINGNYSPYYHHHHHYYCLIMSTNATQKQKRTFSWHRETKNVFVDTKQLKY